MIEKEGRRKDTSLITKRLKEPWGRTPKPKIALYSVDSVVFQQKLTFLALSF